MRYYYHENSDCIFIDDKGKNFGNEHEFTHDLGECADGSLYELRALLEGSHSQLLEISSLEELVGNDLLLTLKERQYMMGILDTFLKISETKGAGSAAIKRNLVSGVDNLFQHIYDEKFRGLFDFVLKVGLDSMLVTHINAIKLVETESQGLNLLSFYELVSRLISVRAVNNELRGLAADYVNSYPVKYRKILSKVLTKGLNIGMGVKEVNKALGRVLIQDIEIMKAESDISIVKKWFERGEEVWAEMKYDGIRGFAEMVASGVKSIKTYNMSELDIGFMTNITEQLNKIHPVWVHYIKEPHYFFDFEITGKERQSVSGEVNKLIQGTAKQGCDKNWVANVFDVHTWEVFDGLPSRVPYSKRRQILEGVVSRTEGDLPNILVAERWKVNNYEELMTLFGKVLEMGCEGLVVKCASGVYEMKRSANWVKMKAEREVDLMIVGWFKGTPGTKRENTIGGFVCQTSDGLLEVSVGSGFKDKDLDIIMKSGPDSYIGKIAKIKYNEVISKKDSEIKSLFLPRFCEIRFDKNVANSLDYVLNKK